MEPVCKVPIRNLFCLLSYANEMPELVESLNEVNEDLITYDFLAKQFLREVNVLKQRGIIRNYVAVTEETNRVGGRILMGESIPHIMARRASLVCEKDEYSEDILLNQIMKTILQGIVQNRYVKAETRQQSFLRLEALQGVSEVPLTTGMFTRLRLDRQNIRYQRMVHMARLLHELRLLSHQQGNWSLFSAKVTERALHQIFEKFLFHFYRLEQSVYKVSSEVMRWNLDGETKWLPTMRTDISMTNRNGQDKIIMDAKFYRNMFQENYGKASFHSHNLYQLYTYLMHQSREMRLRGILVYPFNGVEVNEVFRAGERMTMEVMTLNLDAPWQEIHNRLIMVVQA
ncbi:McrC family protein [Ectobacillus ponti]|uniref:Restriction endonuclease n=1 Tax=Ectobacillus ponti TaxID=2961894 RepID=A0AA41XEX5_9BACI|nr:hypothetical protein [Ectobacillus ponti]MCP8970846.1 hypothetical protein [Ectobacillus ponti]